MQRVPEQVCSGRRDFEPKPYGTHGLPSFHISSSQTRPLSHDESPMKPCKSLCFQHAEAHMAPSPWFEHQCRVPNTYHLSLFGRKSVIVTCRDTIHNSFLSPSTNSDHSNHTTCQGSHWRKATNELKEVRFRKAVGGKDIMQLEPGGVPKDAQASWSDSMSPACQMELRNVFFAWRFPVTWFSSGFASDVIKCNMNDYMITNCHTDTFGQLLFLSRFVIFPWLLSLSCEDPFDLRGLHTNKFQYHILICHIFSCIVTDVTAAFRLRLRG